MFNQELIRELRTTIERQDVEIQRLRAENHTLVERLLQRAGVAPLTQESDSVEAIQRMLASNDIFGEDESIDDELTINDNRKEHHSEFAS